jgi:hypothetical protein
MNLDTLESLAKAADDSWYLEEQLTKLGIADAEYMVAANPETILALIALLREMGGALESMYYHYMNGLSVSISEDEKIQKAITKYKDMK